jgi:hypothetical protein
LNWLRGLQRLGHDVWYVEDDTVWPYDPISNTVTDDYGYAVRHIQRCLDRIGLSTRWAYRLADRSDATAGLSETEITALYRSCDLLLNIVGATALRDSHRAAPFRVYIETDPVTVELELARGDAWSPFDDHHVIATYGENYGAPDCGVPLGGRTYVKTRQPVDLELWPMAAEPSTRCFTTVGNYRQEGKDVEYQGDIYRWSKHHEWERFVDLPQRLAQPFRLALQIDDDDRRRLEQSGWGVVPALEMSLDVFGRYQSFIRTSRGEFTVAKDQNVRLRSGWFSERDACYLASGRPVVTQDTGFGATLPTGQGLFAFTTIEEAIDAVETINSDYPGHRRAARAIAEEKFEAAAVVARLLAELPANPPHSDKGTPR